MLDFLQSLLAPYYLQLKFIHILFVAMWVFSAASAYGFYLLPVMKAWRRNPDDPEIIPVRNWVLDRFDDAVTYEHIAFPMVLISGPLLYIAGGWNPGVGWMDLKLLIVIGLFIPIEIADYYLSHFGGNKRKMLLAGDMVRHEKAVHTHWWFFLITTPAVMIYGVLVMYLAITKPL